MAGGGGALGVERSKRGKASKRKKMKRVGFHLDMTPLVDITFLLLTFFMFTTTMAQPQIMEMSIPPEVDGVEVPEGDLLSLRVRDDGAIFWNIGKDEPVEVDITKLRALIEREHIESNKFNALIVSLKIHDEVPYQKVIKILDELNLAEAFITEKVTSQFNDDGTEMKRERRFTIAPFLEEDMELISEGDEEVTE